MTSRPWTFRAAATAVALATAAATFSTFAVAQADEGAPAPSVERHDPADHAARRPQPRRPDEQDPGGSARGGPESGHIRQGQGAEARRLARSSSSRARRATASTSSWAASRPTRSSRSWSSSGTRSSEFGGTPGPAHNQIAEPDRKKDNSTAWQADYNQKHYQDLYFGTGKRPSR